MSQDEVKRGGTLIITDLLSSITEESS